MKKLHNPKKKDLISQNIVPLRNTKSTGYILMGYGDQK
jgi:hypothetical protein